MSTKNKDISRLYRLFAAKANGTITEGEHEELNACLREDPNTRKLWFQFQDMESGLHDWANVPVPRAQKKVHAWFSRSSFASAAAGIVIGCMVTSSILAISSSQGLSLFFHESFEEGSTVIATGFPDKPGPWASFGAERSGPVGSVQPVDGSRMLKLKVVPDEFMNSALTILKLDEAPSRPGGKEAGASNRSLSITAQFHGGDSGARSRYMMRSAVFVDSIEDIDPVWMRKNWFEIGDHAVSRVTKATTYENNGW